MSEIATPGQTQVNDTVDDMRPQVTRTPASLPEMQAVVCDAASEGHAVIPIGGGGRLQIGNIPTAYHTALSTYALNEIVAFEPADMTVTVQPGIRLYDLQATLAQRGQFLPLDTVGAVGTVGGLLGANAFGSLRHRYGTARDWLIGLHVVHADGTTSKSGGRVVKNVSGYDLHKVHIGALGSLAIITEATFKLAPLPRVDLTIAVACPSAPAGSAIVSECHERGLSVVAAELLSPTASHVVLDQSHWTALLRIAGGDAAVNRTVRDIRDLVALADADLREVEPTTWDRWRSAFASAPLALRLSVPPTSVADTAESVDRRFAGDRVAVTATATVGMLRINLTPGSPAHAEDILHQVKALAAAREGHVMIDAAPLQLKREVDVFGAPRADISIMRRLKNEFDPSGILAPGRFMGRI